MMRAMPDQPGSACLVIADISGYTSYLAGVELDHAQDILADLMGTVVGSLRPTFRLAKLEGDAAFVYAMTETLDRSLLLDTVEATYFAFRRRLRDIAQASACDCNACMRMPSLDLKLVLHHGPVAQQRMAGQAELVGRDVIVVHRLLKNDIVDALGLPAYALYSEACLAAAGIDDPGALGLVRHEETYEHVGTVVGWVADLHRAWADETGRTVVELTPDNAITSIQMDFPAPPAVVWEYVTSPVRRPKWQAGVEAVEEAAPAGRRGVGTVNHCVHGKDAIVEEILDWRPPTYFTVRSTLPLPGGPKFTMTDRLEATDGGTRITSSIGNARSSRERALLAELLEPMLFPMFKMGRGQLVEVLAQEMAGRPAGPAEPEVPLAVGREPVRA